MVPYVGAPLVRRICPTGTWTKDVRIDLGCFNDDPSNHNEKTSFLEFWFKSDPSSPQWEECIMFETGGAPGKKQPCFNESGGFFAIWKAGDQNQIFKQARKIRVMVTTTMRIQ